MLRCSQGLFSPNFTKLLFFSNNEHVYHQNMISLSARCYNIFIFVFYHKDCWLVCSAVTGPHRELVLEQKVDQVKNMGFDEVCTS